MNKTFIKVLCFVLAVTFLFFTIAGCSQGEAKEEMGKNNENLEQGTKKATHRVELKVAVFDRGIDGYIPNNNFQTQWIQEKFGDPNNIKVTFVPIPRWQEAERLNVLMAANQAPDICFTYDGQSVVNYVKNGSLTELNSLLDQYAPNLKQYFGEELLSYGRWDGVQYTLHAKRINRAAIATFIRKDWLDAVNMPIPQTTEEFYQTLKAFKEQDPGGLGDSGAPFSFFVDAKNITWTVHTLLNSFIEEITEEERSTLPNWLLPGYKEGVRFLNKLYNEGLISKKITNDLDGTQYTQEITAGRIGVFINGYDLPYRASGGMARYIKANVAGAELIPIDPFTNYEGKHPKMIYNPNGVSIMIPKASARAVEAMKYLEWLSNPDVIFFLQNGEEGIHYKEKKDGIPVGIVPMDQVPAERKANFLDLAFIVNGKDFGSQERNMEADSLSYPEFEELYKQAYKIAVTDGVSPARFDNTTEASAKFGKVLEGKGVEIFLKSITCSPEEFDKTYDTLLDEYLKSGGQEIINEKIELYRLSKEE
jgi:putative aldouronate transport system substrate-binding protein